MPDDSFHWLDVDIIGEELARVHPEVDPLRTGFVQLKTLVAGLQGFREKAGHPVNERILEEIQVHWIEAREARL